MYTKVAMALAIVFGKRDGAAQHHRWGLRGLRDMMPETAKVILDKTRFMGLQAMISTVGNLVARRPAGCQPPGTPWMAGKNMSCHFSGRTLMEPTPFMNSAYFMRFSGDVV